MRWSLCLAVFLAVGGIDRARDDVDPPADGDAAKAAPASAEPNDQAPPQKVFAISAKSIQTARSTAAFELARRGDRTRHRPAGLDDIETPDGLRRTIAHAVRDLEFNPDWEQASQKLNYLGRYAYPALLEGLKSPSANIRLRCAHLLRSHGLRPITALERMLESDPFPSVRAEAATTLSLTYHPKVLPALIAALDDPAQEVRFHTLFGLGYLRDERAIDAVTALSDDPQMKSYVPNVLATIRGPKSEGTAWWPVALLELRQLAQDAHTYSGEDYKQDQFDQLLAHIDSEYWGVRDSCLLALEHLDVRAAVPAIIRLKASSMKFHALVKLATPEAVDHVVAQLHSPDKAVREMAIESLGDAGRWGVPMLIDLLDDSTLLCKENDLEGFGLGGFGGAAKWPASHAAHSALNSCLWNNGLKGEAINLATDESNDVQEEMKRARTWWKQHGADYLQYRAVPNPKLTTVFYSS